MRIEGSAASAAPTCHRLRSPGESVVHRESVAGSSRNSPRIRRASPSSARANEAISAVIVSTVCTQTWIRADDGSRKTWPATGSSSPEIMRSKVVLPAPLGPTTPVHPGASVSVTSARIETESAYEKERPESRANIVTTPERYARGKIAARALSEDTNVGVSYFCTLLSLSCDG